MDHDQNQGTPMPSLMNWDRDGELRSEDLERLLARLQAQEVNSQKQAANAQSGRCSRPLMPQTPLCQPLLLGGVQ